MSQQQTTRKKSSNAFGDFVFAPRVVPAARTDIAETRFFSALRTPKFFLTIYRVWLE
jgi:hypothetical protein